MDRSLIDLGTQPLGHTLSSAELDADRLDYLFDALAIVELPVVLDAFPRFDSVEARAAALRRGREGLIADGLLPDGRVHRDVEAWMRVLEQPEWYVSARGVSRPFDPDTPIARICSATSHIGSVTATRSGSSLILRATNVLPEYILDTLGGGQAYEFRGISAPTDLLAEALDAAPADAVGTAARLSHIGVDPETARELASALSTCSRHSEITSVTVRSGNRFAGEHPVAFFDTHKGRILATSSTASDGQRWTSLSPGSDARVKSALAEVVERAAAS